MPLLQFLASNKLHAKTVSYDCQKGRLEVHKLPLMQYQSQATEPYDAIAHLLYNARISNGLSLIMLHQGIFLCLSQCDFFEARSTSLKWCYYKKRQIEYVATCQYSALLLLQLYKTFLRKSASHSTNHQRQFGYGISLMVSQNQFVSN